MFDKSFVVVDTRILSVYSQYPWKDKNHMLYAFGKELLYTRFSHAQMKKGTPYARNMTTTLERMHAMGFPNHFIWMRLPIEATDWGMNPKGTY